MMLERIDPKFATAGGLLVAASGVKFMGQPNALDTVNNLTEAINRGDIDRALSLYEPEAVLIAQPGKVARGTDAIRTALEGFISLKPSLRTQTHQVVEAGDVALYCSTWTIVGTSPEGRRVEMNGISSDVLRRQADGQWLIVVDNPWGTSIVS